MMLQILIPTIIGALTNKEDPIRGALLGGTLGALTGSGMGPKTGVIPNAQASKAKDVAKVISQVTDKSNAVATAAPSIPAPVSTPLSLGQIGKTGTELANLAGSPTAYAKTLGFNLPTTTASTASTASSTPMAAINKQIAELGIKEAAPSTFDKILATAKEKPLQTMDLLSSVSGDQQQAPAPSMAPLTQPGGFGNVPTVEQSIGMDSGPRFVSKGLFDESKRSMEEEEMALMYEKLSEAGLV